MSPSLQPEKECTVFFGSVCELQIPLYFSLPGKIESVVGAHLIYFFIFIIGADSFGANKLGICLDLFFIVTIQTFLFLLLPILSLCSAPATVSDVQFSWAKQV